jgi:uncharacterized protein
VRVHVSIHDVAPPFRKEIELALEMAHARGAKPALLVVPDFHRSAPLARDPSFCAWLRELQTQGHEVFLHGLFHEAEAGARAHRVSSYFAQHVVSDGEAEMSGLSSEEAAERIDEGTRALEAAGLHVDGFVPPAWSLPRGLLPVLAARGCAYTEDHTRVYAPNEGRSRASLVLNYASRTPLRLFSSVLFCRAATPLAPLVPARVAIHPADTRFELLRREVTRLLAWGEGHFVTRGTDLFA